MNAREFAEATRGKWVDCVPQTHGGVTSSGGAVVGYSDHEQRVLLATDDVWHPSDRDPPDWVVWRPVAHPYWFALPVSDVHMPSGVIAPPGEYAMTVTIATASYSCQCGHDDHGVGRCPRCPCLVSTSAEFAPVTPAYYGLARFPEKEED